MPAAYQLAASSALIIRTADEAFIPNDPSNRDWAAYQAWLAAGNTPDPYVPPVVSVTSVSPRQARLALLQAGMLTQVQNAINAADQATQLTWEYASTFDRNSPLIASIGTALGLTSAQIDQLFTTASTL